MKNVSGVIFLSAAFLFTIFFWLAAVCPASAIENNGLGGRPAYPRADNSRSESIFIHDIAPGQVIEDGIRLINNTSQTRTLLVYAADSIPSTDGGFACRQFGEEGIQVAPWITLESSEVTLGPVTSQIVPFVIRIPWEVEVGEHNACILIQEKKESFSDKAGINLSMRTGIRVVLTVPGEIVRLLSLGNFTASRQKTGRFFLTPEIKNSGNVSVDAEVKVTTRNLLGGISAEHGGKYHVLRSDTSRWNFEFIPSEWGSRYTSQVSVRYNNGVDDILLESGPVSYIVWPTHRALLFIGLALLPLILLVCFLLIRRAAFRRKYRKWIEYRVQKGDHLNSLARKHMVSWKELARANKLRPPYDLRENQTIKLPL